MLANKGATALASARKAGKGSKSGNAEEFPALGGNKADTTAAASASAPAPAAPAPVPEPGEATAAAVLSSLPLAPTVRLMRTIVLALAANRMLHLQLQDRNIARNVADLKKLAAARRRLWEQASLA